MNDLDLDLHFDRARVHPGGDSVRYLLAQVTASELSDEQRAAPPPLDLALAIDVSGSMHGPPLEFARKAAIGVAGSLRPGDRLTLVTFEDDVHILLEGEPMSAAGKEKAIAAIRALETGGTTYLSGGWLTAANLLAGDAAARGGRRCQVILLSDGHANRGTVEPEFLAREACALAERGVPTTTVGVGDGYSAVQLQSIAEHGGGRMHDAERPDEIVQVVSAELSGLGGIAAEQVKLLLAVPDGVEVESLTSFPVDEHQDGLSCSFGSLLAGASRTAVLRVRTPAGAADDELDFAGTLRWRRPGAEEDELTEPTRARLVIGDERDQRPALEHALTVVSAWQSQLVRRVTALNRDQAFDELRRLGERDLEHFRRYCAFHVDTERYAEEVERLLGRALRPMPERSLKEIDLAHHKRVHADLDHRVQERPVWTHYLRED